ncbi:ABC transporter permease [Corynebacterium incognita]|uniref:ABC transporter permease n=1 Tax=Corynebacterium incognita TaxID=2754725 RepID=A0A7G7CM59_9CORY|nr:FtsX-like permease family protein [Corynebacterium incognita]QNE88675.1 ABC transporter permease [Corynebacterium incognita]
MAAPSPAAVRTSSLVWDLQKASLSTRAGTGVVSVLAVFSLTVASCIAFLVAGGTWMFYQRMKHPSPELPSFVFEYPAGAESFLSAWFALSLVACAFIVPALFSLVAQAAVLGASGRERRLAVLRLLGLSSGDVTRMTVLETGLQALIGIVLGLASSVLIAPAFTTLKFTDLPIKLEEILLPWWGYLAVSAVLLVLALGAAFMGMQRVRVSPLGVAKKEMPKALKSWRLILFVVIAVGGYIGLKTIELGAEVGSILGLAAFLFMVIMGLGMAVPFILQWFARLAALFPGTAHFVACRRISTNPRQAWKRSSAIAFFGFLTGILVISPLGNDGLSEMFKQEPDAALIFRDITTGALLTVIFGFAITCVSIFLGQASEVYESADLTRSLSLIGVKRRFHSLVAIIEILGPIFLVSIFGFAMGALMGFAMLGAAGDMNVPARLTATLALLGSGWALTALAILAAEPLRSSVLRRAERKND